MAKRKAEMRNKQGPTSVKEEEDRKKEEYLEKAEVWKVEEEAKLEKRLQKFEEFHETAVLKLKKRDKNVGADGKTKLELDSEGNVIHRDVSKRNVQEIDLELTQEQINTLQERNKIFDAREKEVNPNQKRKVDMSLTVEYAEKCEDVYWWMQKMIRDWSHDQETKPRGYSETCEGRKNSEIFRETKRHLLNLYEILLNKTIPEEILNALYQISHYSLQREYVKAHDKYYLIAIGTDPWPIGVTMVGIHERSGRAKIFTNQISHIMNDDAQKLYIQSFKRILTFAQKKFPANPSKMVIY